MRPREKRLAVFLTTGRGLRTWERVGSLSRELALYRALGERGWRVAIYTFDRLPYVPAGGFEGLIVPQWPFVLPKAWSTAYGLLIPWLKPPRPSERPHVIMTNQAHGGLPAVIAAKIWGAPLVARSGNLLGDAFTLRNDDSLRAKRIILEERFVHRAAAECILPTAELAEFARVRYGLGPRIIHVVPNFVDTDLFRPRPALPRHDVVSVGRLDDHKRHDLLIEALAGTGLCAAIVGTGEAETRLRALARARGVPVEFIARVENQSLPELLNAARVFVILSKREGNSKALIEAMACGCACVGADAPGIASLIDHDSTGLVVTPEVSELGTVLRALSKDEGLRRRLGLAARQRAVSTYGLDHVSARYDLVLSSLAGRE
ncbi:MAG: glycosyltransferase family 4 protein [Deltaproteobacteria bacterium]|nr:glycosyltransferase family 4 protein [Deltaproteobacteria bacterium]